MVLVELLGPLDAALGGVMEFVLLALVLVNMVTRGLAHASCARAYESGGAEAIERYVPHEVSNVALVLAAFYYLTLHHHSGMVASMLVVGLFITDFFEFEARKVEARREIGLGRPKSAIAASVLVLLYVAYVSLFFVVEPVWSAVV